MPDSIFDFTNPLTPADNIAGSFGGDVVTKANFMDVRDFSMNQVQFVMGQMPSFRLPSRLAITQAAFAMSQNPFDFASKKLNYRFTADSLVASHGSDALANTILDSISRNQTGLKLFTTTANYRSEFGNPQQHQIYRLESTVNHAYFDFDLWPEDDGLYAHALIVFVLPDFQGRWFSFREFLIDRVAKTLFDCRHKRIFYLGGRAVPSQFVIRQRHEWRDRLTKDKKSTKLARVYERCGFVKPDDSDTVVLLSAQTQQEYAASSSPTKRLLAEKHGKLARRTNTVNST